MYFHFPMFPMFPGTTSSCICSSVVSVFNLVFFLFKDSFLSGFCCGLTCSTFMNVWCLSEATFLFSIKHCLLFSYSLESNFLFQRRRTYLCLKLPHFNEDIPKDTCIHILDLIFFVFLPWWHWQGGANFGSLCNLIGHCSPFFLPFGDTCAKLLFLRILPFGVFLWTKKRWQKSMSYH